MLEVKITSLLRMMSTGNKSNNMLYWELGELRVRAVGEPQV